MYSRKLVAVDDRDPQNAVKQLLQQLQLIQEESEREIEQMKKKIKELEARP